MKTRTRAWILAGTMLLAAAAGASAQGAPSKGSGALAAAVPEKTAAVLGKRLGLSEAQVGQVKKIYAEALAGSRITREDIKIQRAELAKALMAASPARADYEKIVRKIADLEASLRLTRIEAELKIRGTIGDEKWAQLRRIVRTQSEKAKAEIKQKLLKRSAKK